MATITFNQQELDAIRGPQGEPGLDLSAELAALEARAAYLSYLVDHSA